MSWSTEPITKLLYALDRINDSYAFTLGPVSLPGLQVVVGPISLTGLQVLGSTLALVLLTGFLTTRDDASGSGARVHVKEEEAGKQEKGKGKRA
jgi:hypothetical protein